MIVILISSLKKVKNQVRSKYKLSVMEFRPHSVGLLITSTGITSIDIAPYPQPNHICLKSNQMPDADVGAATIKY